MNEKPSVRSQQDALRKQAAGHDALSSSYWKFFKYSLPFFVMLGGGSVVLFYAQKIRNDFRKVKSEIDKTNELKGRLAKKGVDVEDKRSLDDLSKDLDNLDVDNWTNIRGPRPHEDNKEYIQSRDKKKQEAEHSKKSRVGRKPLSEPP